MYLCHQLLKNYKNNYVWLYCWDLLNIQLEKRFGSTICIIYLALLLGSAEYSIRNIWIYNLYNSPALLLVTNITIYVFLTDFYKIIFFRILMRQRRGLLRFTKKQFTHCHWPWVNCFERRKTNHSNFSSEPPRNPSSYNIKF